MQKALILLVISAALLFAEAQHYHPKPCGRCVYDDHHGDQGPPGPKV